MSRLPAEGGPTGADWVRSVDRLTAECLEEWDLALAGEPMTGWTAVVHPVVRRDNPDSEPLVLKVGWPHVESAQEHLALRAWDGRGSVRLAAADPSRGALLLERLDSSRDLETVDIDEACTAIGGLYRELHVAAPPTIRTLAAYLDPYLTRLRQRTDIPRRVVTRVTGLARELLAEPGPRVLLHTDLHFQNVLAARRAPWLAIDPKPLAGAAGYELHPLLRNRFDELGTGASMRWSVRHRLEVTCDAAGLDEEVGRLWCIVRCGVEVLWAAVDGDEAELSKNLTLLKALDD
ncbi:putative aminoglycoside phosphotransferase [Janibacter sp. HTCC2649]|uniref:aminoglycoside phosphotransferase family protein n=1 Tax=Janibacter sp. HTCC2649 TaxID=313589 RepID=UPI000066F64A|nr:aminoglycoside phosphotransferase family protein [Janibacter sp. HTCC2649]EAP96990.1 putative aminoglycoside phosphotransferase [Janibacter sp. HTCC2649]